MVWQPFKSKIDSHLVTKDKEMKNYAEQPRRGCNKCGNRCKKCGENCKCTVHKVIIRPPMFNYYTDMMH